MEHFQPYVNLYKDKETFNAEIGILIPLTEGESIVDDDKLFAIEGTSSKGNRVHIFRIEIKGNPSDSGALKAVSVVARYLGDGITPIKYRSKNSAEKYPIECFFVEVRRVGAAISSKPKGKGVYTYKDEDDISDPG